MANQKYSFILFLFRIISRILLREPVPIQLKELIPMEDPILLRRSTLRIEKELLIMFYNLSLDALHATL